MAHMLVTGGAGFIGSHLVDRLISLGHQVTVVDNLSTGSVRNIPQEAHLVDVDISNFEQLSYALGSCRFDFIFHLAAQTNLRRSFEDCALDASTNIIGSINLLKVFPRITNSQWAKFIFVSTGGAMYSPDSPLPWTEQSETNPPSPYGISKLSAEHYVKLTPNNCIFRLANVYGPRQNNKSEAGVISIFINKIIQEEDITIFGDGHQSRDFVYVDDVVDALLLGLDPQVNGTFNVSTGIGVTINKITEMIVDQMWANPKINHVEAVPGEIKHTLLDNSKLKQMGWQPRVSLDVGVARTVNYFSDI